MRDIKQGTWCKRPEPRAARGTSQLWPAELPGPEGTSRPMAKSEACSHRCPRWKAAGPSSTMVPGQCLSPNLPRQPWPDGSPAHLEGSWSPSRGRPLPLLSLRGCIRGTSEPWPGWSRPSAITAGRVLSPRVSPQGLTLSHVSPSLAPCLREQKGLRTCPERPG